MKKRILAALLAVLMVVLLVPAVLISSISAATTWVVQNETFETGTFDTTHAKFGHFFDTSKAGDIWSIGETGGNKYLLSPDFSATNNFKGRSVKGWNSVTATEPVVVKFDMKFSTINVGLMASGGGYAFIGLGSGENNFYGNGSYNVKLGATEVGIGGKDAAGTNQVRLADTATGKTLVANTTYAVKLVFSRVDTSNVKIDAFIDNMTTPVGTTTFALSGNFGGYVNFGLSNAKYSVDNLSIYKGDDPVASSSAASSSAASSSAASSSAASSSAVSSAASSAASSATSSIGATGLANITMGKTKNSLLSENFDGANVNAAFSEMTAAGWAVADGKYNNTAQTKDQYGNRSGLFTDSSVDFDDFTLEMDVAVSEDFSNTWRSTSFYFRSIPVGTESQKKVNTAYYFVVGKRSGILGAQFAKRVGGNSVYLNGDATSGVAIPEAAGITTTTKSYRVKIVAEGTTFKGYINDVFVCEATDATYTSGGFGIASTNQIVTLDNFNVYSPLTLPGATFDLGADYANRKVELHSTVKTGTTNAQGLVTFTNIEAGTHQLKVYDAAGTNVAYTVDLFLAEGTALEAGGNGVNMTTAGATIVLRLVGTQLVITSASSGLGSAVITSQGPAPTGDTTNVWMLLAIMAIAAGAVFTVKKIKV